MSEFSILAAAWDDIKSYPPRRDLLLRPFRYRFFAAAGFCALSFVALTVLLGAGSGFVAFGVGVVAIFSVPLALIEREKLLRARGMIDATPFWSELLLDALPGPWLVGCPSFSSTIVKYPESFGASVVVMPGVAELLASRHGVLVSDTALKIGASYPGSLSDLLTTARAALA